ncbi:MAG UNVERIFIED_CONTAM: hypothetical protein LVT10_03295 [Anaerolineae bacterium]
MIFVLLWRSTESTFTAMFRVYVTGILGNDIGKAIRAIISAIFDRGHHHRCAIPHRQSYCTIWELLNHDFLFTPSTSTWFQRVLPKHWYAHLILTVAVAVIGFPMFYALLISTQNNAMVYSRNFHSGSILLRKLSNGVGDTQSGTLHAEQLHHRLLDCLWQNL